MDGKNIRIKKRALVGFGCFLAFLAVCTLITKIIYVSGMALVTVGNPERRSITHNIVLQGRVRPVQEYGIYVRQGLRVETIYIKTGQRVEEGTPLFQVRMEDLEQLIAYTKEEIRYRQALLADESGQKKEEWQERQDRLAGLREDYDMMVRELDIAVEKKLLAYEAARQAREQAEEDLLTVSGGDGASLERCKLAESQAALELEEILMQKEQGIREWERQYGIAQRVGYDAVAETVSLEHQLGQSRDTLEVLQELYVAEGVVCAPEEGIIVESRLRTGEYTTDTACMLFAQNEDLGSLEFVLDDVSLGCLSVGDSVDLEYRTDSGEKRLQEGTIAYIESRGGDDVARVNLAGAQWTVGQTVTLKYQYVTDTYPTVISRQALVEENNQYYVYVAEEQAGFLGTEERIRKVYVTLTDSNDSLAAVESAVLGAESKIVLQSNRDLAEGDLVRLLDGK